MSTNRTTVLFVDDDVGFLEVVQNLMQVLSEELWEVLVAPDAAHGLALIRQRKIDLLVIDVRMPVMDGMQFLALLHRNYPSLLKVALTGEATETYRAACLSNGAELFLEKPTTQQGWQGLYSTLNELVRFQPEEGFRGVLRRVGLQDVLQMECLARSSSVLEISTGQTRGSVYVQEGQIIHAEVGGITGEEAFNRLMALSGGQFSLKPFVEPPARTLTGSWEFLLMEAARMRDEAGDTSLAPADPDAAAEPVVPAGVDEIFTRKPAASAPMGTLADHDSATEDVAGAELVPGLEATTPSEPAENLRPKVDEVLICSTQGDVLYEWQCTDANARIRFLQFVSQKSWQLRQGLAIGHFQRLEVEGTKNRIVTQIDPDRALFVRVSRLPLDIAG